MAEDKRCCDYLCDPALLSAGAAIRLTRSLLLVEPRLDLRLAHAAVQWADIEEEQNALRRSLEILEAVTSGSRIGGALVQLLSCRNLAVRSKVAELLVRSATIRSHRTIREWLRNPDARVRANVLEALADVGQERTWIPQILLDSLNDPDGRAAANAAIGLYRLGLEDTAIAGLTEMAASKDPSIRRSAAWAMGQVPNGQLFEVLNRLRSDSNERVRRHALKSLCTLGRSGVKPNQILAPIRESCGPMADKPF
jgi:hypothetical protein